MYSIPEHKPKKVVFFLSCIFPFLQSNCVLPIFHTEIRRCSSFRNIKNHQTFQLNFVLSSRRHAEILFSALRASFMQALCGGN